MPMQHIVLGIIFLVVAIVSVVSVIRQLKYRNFLALGFSVLSVLAFGFFSIATIISVLKDNL
ncbi:DUF2759 family protein [Ornithinibacillus halotolerans]|uniref:DUF2759 domain-containing protein n=1 Tax=Ornithinibacillus halotolerans TaxID=1274357 RepID=A0A916RSN2_9BACI|nr:DUF2759 family protein [Ornithinibacillus halotolerans]GGA68359.1 hypothetical protein GCM10008025_10420 [Ornithinibacillus halotolerans]